jgi:hypothetical protein
MLPVEIATALEALLARLSGSPITWALTGSTAFALRGMDLRPADIDLQTDMQGAYAIERLFPQKSHEPVRFVRSENLRSHLGAFEVQGVRVEVIGDIQKRMPDGSWTEPPDLQSLIKTVPWHGLRVPLLPLAYEASAYAQMGRGTRAQQIRQFLIDHDND